MKIVSVSWVRNEADLIEAFVRHHCAFLDRMIIIDNRSRDNTGEILQQLQQEGLPLDLRYDDSFVHRQGEALTALLAKLRPEAPDYVLPLDADEFLWTNHQEGVRQSLENLPQNAASLVQWHTYIPMPEDDRLQSNILKRIRHRKACEMPQWRKVIIPGALLKKNVKLDMGSHALVHADTDENVTHSDSNTLFLGHFPVRSPSQIAGKVFGGWLSHCANPARTPGTIFQWKAIFDELQSGKEIDAATLMRIALEYGTEKQWLSLPAEERGTNTLTNVLTKKPDAAVTEETVVLDPIPVKYDLKYPAKRLTPLHILAESAEVLAQEVADLRSGRRKID